MVVTPSHFQHSLMNQLTNRRLKLPEIVIAIVTHKVVIQTFIAQHFITYTRCNQPVLVSTSVFN